MVVVVFVQRVVVPSQYDISIFVVVVRHSFVFMRFIQAKYIRSKTRHQINDRQYDVETRVICILVTIDIKCVGSTIK